MRNLTRKLKAENSGLSRRDFLKVSGTGLAAGIVVGREASSVAAGGAILIRNARLIDGNGKVPLENASILIVGGRIQKIAQRELRAPAGAKEIDAVGKTVLPGL